MTEYEKEKFSESFKTVLDYSLDKREHPLPNKLLADFLADSLSALLLLDKRRPADCNKPVKQTLNIPF